MPGGSVTEGMRAAPHPEPVGGLRFGRYEIIRPLGEGGMAQVYLAARLGAGGFVKPVVLKVLHSRFLSEGPVVDMFLEEARVLARLQHPHIVDVDEVECVGGVPYLAMEYVHGPTLGDLQRHVGRPGRDTIGFFLLLLRQVCDALHYAHTLTLDGRPLGLVHRDVSSQNIVIDASTGGAKLIDFGIAKAVDSAQHTEIGVLKGKVHYMAPEVLTGARPDGRADIYSVGVLLYRILSGRAPFRPAELFGRELPAPELSYPPGIAAVVEKATRNSRDERYSTAAQLSADLQRLVDDLGVTPPQLAPFIAKVFPRGEEDWRRHEVEQSVTPHRSLQMLATEAASFDTLGGSPLIPPLGSMDWISRSWRSGSWSTVTLWGVAIGAMLLALSALLLAAVAVLVEVLLA
jgi:serine/threonine protein kinase